MNLTAALMFDLNNFLDERPSIQSKKLFPN